MSSGLRVSSFARSMTRRGHRIILLSPADAETDVASDPATVANLLEAHDWSEPLHLTAEFARALLVQTVRGESYPGWLRKPMVAYLFFAEGGVHGDWERGSRPLATAIAQQFKPEAVWSVFGNASTLTVAQKLAGQAGCPWMMDIKDNWESYTPQGVRGVMRRRFADAAGFTTNARLHGEIASKWLNRDGEVIYSGVADAMVASPDEKASSEACLITLIGSTYRPEVLSRFLGVLGRWVDTLGAEDRERVLVRYAGGAQASVRDQLARTPLNCRVEVTGNIPHAELATLCQSAAVNCYLWVPYGFHHKMLELLSTRRPAISFPGEHPESIELAAAVGGELMACTDETALTAAFETIWRRWRAGDVGASAVDVSAFSWDAGAEKLEACLQAAIDG